MDGQRVPLRVSRLAALLDELLGVEALAELRERVRGLRAALQDPADPLGVVATPADTDVEAVRLDLLDRQLAQAEAAYTRERAGYYLRRLRRALTERRTKPINEINLNRWQEYEEVLTDSLWLIDRRDSSGAHLAWYWGNFVPQIPRQAMWRFTRRGEWVLDPFVGSGTTLIECRRLGRHGVGIELNPEVARRAEARVAQEPNPYDVQTPLIVGDATSFDLDRLPVRRFQLVVMHPPYHDIIRFSDDPRDLSAAPSVEAFLARWRQAVEHVYPLLEPGRFMVVVIGDKYVRGEWIPLGFYGMQEALAVGFRLKSIVVKNFEGTRGKRSQEALWRYRALAGGFYVFKHEYIFFLEKT